MLYFITLLIDVCLFLDYNRQKEGNCKWRKKNFAELWLFFLSAVFMKLTDLSGASDSYYEDQELIKPDRNEGNRRMYSLNDMDRLLEIKDYISEGYNIAAIKKKYAEREAKSKKPVSQTEVRRALRNEVLQQSRFASQQSPFGRG